MVQEDVISPVLAHPNGVRRQGSYLEASLEGCPSLSTRARCMGRFILAAGTQNPKSDFSSSDCWVFLTYLWVYSNRGCWGEMT